MSSVYTPRLAPDSRAAQPPAKPVGGMSVTLELSAEERAAIASACLGMSVQMFCGADRMEAAGLFEKADSLRHDALVLSRAELAVRNAK